MSRPTQAVVSLPNLRHNVGLLRARLRPETGYMAVVKANAYGHGMERVALAALEAGASMLGVAFAEEGLRLRRAGIDAPILLLGIAEEESLDAILEHALTPTVCDCRTLRLLQARAAARHARCRVHLKVDTGMRRIGFISLDAFGEALTLLKASPNLEFHGLFTHFAVSELEDGRFTRLQGERFCAFAAAAREAGFSPLLHAANSGAILNHPALQFDLVRGGIAMYGYHPAGRPAPGLDLRPVMRFVTRIAFIKPLAPGEGVSYGLRFTADRPMRVATLPVGYGDGYRRALSGRADVLIRGRRARQIGTICMDQMLCDLSDIPDAAVGDEVVLIGAQGGERITADELAELAGTISYEILLGIDSRVPRVYTEEAD
ncbi:MAG: alanine racemase, partial [Clostridia bacterium]|nr:alanine racemase [Clostridia bacterium]